MRCYPINNDWLGQNAADPDAYVDVREIRAGTSRYVSDMNLDPAVEAAKLSFHVNGIRIGNANNGGNLYGRMFNDTFDHLSEFVGGVDHPETYGRIYAMRTQVRNIKFVGY